MTSGLVQTEEVLIFRWSKNEVSSVWVAVLYTLANEISLITSKNRDSAIKPTKKKLLSVHGLHEKTNTWISLWDFGFHVKISIFFLFYGVISFWLV